MRSYHFILIYDGNYFCVFFQDTHFLNNEEVVGKSSRRFLDQKIYFSIYFYLKTYNKHSYHTSKPISQLKNTLKSI